MTLFESVKDSVTTRQAAERYGLHIGHGGMCKCPFHNDKNPSMKVDRRYHCFGCSADGDVISFAGRLFNLPAKEAAMKLADDFGISYDRRPSAPRVKRHVEVREEDVFKHKAAYVYQELSDYRNLLVRWKQQYAPKSPDEEMHPRFMEALNNLPLVEYQLDILLSDADAEKRKIVSDFLNSRKNQKEAFIVEPMVKTPIYHQSAAYARQHGELDQFRDSHWTNIHCKNDIEKAIAEHFDGFRLNRKAVDGVMERYGEERVSIVLAATVQVKAWDGRFSSANKDWAFTFDFPDPVNDAGIDRRDSYAVTTHPAVLDGFINLVRQKIRERMVPVEKTEAAAEPALPKKPDRRKTHDIER